jgi:hypothetical protein
MISSGDMPFLADRPAVRRFSLDDRQDLVDDRSLPEPCRSTPGAGRPRASQGPGHQAVARARPPSDRAQRGVADDRPSRGRTMAARSRRALGHRVEPWLALLCTAMAVAWVIQRLVPNQADAIEVFATPDWLPLTAACLAATGAVPLGRAGMRRRVRGALRWAALLLMVWAASGLPFDLLTAAGLVGHRTATGEIVLSTVSWPVLATRVFALAVVVLLARLTLASPAGPASGRQPAWFGYAAFALALPYPVLRVHWAMGGTLGLTSAGGAGAGWEPLLIAAPWALAAALSLLLVSPPRWMPRRLLLAAGWSATAVVAMIGPAAFWSFVSALATGGELATGEIELWVFGLFYGSWFLWTIAAGSATRAYQLRSGRVTRESPGGA